MGKYLSLKAYGDTVGPLGFRQTSTAAKATEDALKKQPSELRSIFKTNIIGADGKEATVDGYARLALTPDQTELVSGEHADISVVTSDAVDRDGEVVLADGGDFKQFLANPVVPFNHDYSALPVGRCLWMTALRSPDSNLKGWKAKTRYTARPKDQPESVEWLPDTVFHFVQAGDLRGKSIGFIPLNIRAASRDELKSRPDWKDARHIISDWLLLEYSPCSIPCNQTALVDAVAKAADSGMKLSKQFLDSLGVMLPAPAPAESPIVINTNDLSPANEGSMADGGAVVASSESANMHSHSTTQIDLPQHVSAAMKALASRVKDEHLADDGREDDPHITLHYGLHTDDPDEVRKAVAGAAPVSVKLGKVKHFPATDDRKSDVLHVEASGKGLHALKKRLAALPHSNPNPEYSPHATLAYLKPGMAKDYDDMDGMEGLSMMCSAITFSDKTGKKTVIPLNGTKSLDSEVDMNAMPVCPKCKSNANVTPMRSPPDKQVYVCSACKHQFDGDGDETVGEILQEGKGAGGMELHAAGESHCRSAIERGEISDGTWSRPKDSELDPNFCLGQDTSKPQDTAGRWAYPVGKSGKVYRRAVADAESRASAAGVTSIASAAKSLMEMIQKRDEKNAPLPEPKFTEAQIAKAVEAKVLSNISSIKDRAAEQAKIAVLAAMGRP